MATEEFGAECVVTEATIRRGLSRLADGDDVKGAVAAIVPESSKRILTDEERDALVESVRLWSR